jgi:polysaccharide biosynthesis transport protein
LRANGDYVLRAAHIDRDAERPLPRSRPDWTAREPRGPEIDGEESRDSLHDFFSLLARRKLVLLLCVILTPLGALAYSLLQTELYAGSAAVLVTSGGASALSEVPGLAAADSPERFAATHVSLARLPTVAQRVIDEAPLFEEPEDFLGRSSVSAQEDADILRFTVSDPVPEQSRRLATIYAEQFTRYRNRLDVLSIQSTRASIEGRLAKLAAAGQRGSALYVQLRTVVRELDAAEAVRGSAAIVVQPAITATQVSPQTKRNVVLGIVMGLFLGVGLALLVDRLDRRVRSAEAAEAMLGLPVLGELSPPPALPERARTTVSMVEFPYGSYAEGVRKLRTNLEFANIDIGARVFMVTSSVTAEGKTTVASDLAVALARSGRTVALVDLDPRAPALHKAFSLHGRRGLVDVAFGLQSLEDALVPIQWVVPERSALRTSHVEVPVSLHGDDIDDLLVDPPPKVPAQANPRGRLSVLPLGSRLPPSPAEFVGSATVQHLVAELASTHDFVILDTAPLLPVSDSLTISEYADAALLVIGLEKIRRPDLRRVQKLISTFPTRVLGFVVTGVAAEEGYGPYFVTGPDARPPTAERE